MFAWPRLFFFTSFSIPFFVAYEQRRFIFSFAPKKKTMQHSDIDRAMRNLCVISAVNQNDKLMTEGEYFSIYVPTTLRSWMRFLSNENRESNITKVCETVRIAKSFITSILSEDYACEHDSSDSFATKMHKIEQVHIVVRVFEILSQVTHGLKNLSSTYKDDPALNARINNLISNINCFISNASRVSHLKRFEHIETGPLLE